MGQENPIHEIDAYILVSPTTNDPEGNTILDGLHQLGFNEVSKVRFGHVVTFDVNASTTEEAISTVERVFDPAGDIPINSQIYSPNVHQVTLEAKSNPDVTQTLTETTTSTKRRSKKKAE